MDPPLNPPLFPEPTAAPPFPTAPAASPTPTAPLVHNHPPYTEMIAAAISSLNEPDGSSKRAIAKYMEAQYTGLPPNHSALLTHHIKSLKATGHLVMVKNSYKLPGSTPVATANGAVNAVTSDPAPSGLTKRRGRPPKPKPEFLQAAVAVPVFEPSMNMNATPVFIPVAAEPPPILAAGPVNGLGPTPTGAKRGRGRPPKQGGPKRVPGRPPKSGGAGRGRGRPKMVATTEADPPKGSGRPRGRPRKAVGGAESVVSAPVGGSAALPVGGGGAPVVAGKRRGRPPRAISEAKKKQKAEIMAQPKKPRKSSGKPVGRPRKNALPTPAQTTGSGSHLLMAYLDLKGKYDNLQSRVKQAASVIKPCLNNEGAFDALQELELLADGDMNQQPLVQPPQQLLVQPPQQPLVQTLRTEPSQPVMMPQFQS